MKNMDIINLNQVSKIILTKKHVTKNIEVHEHPESFLQWFKNFFRKNKVKKKYFKYKWTYPEDFFTLEEVNDFLEKYKAYTFNPTIEKFYQKASVTLYYSENRMETRYFESDKEASAYFDKLVEYAKENNVPFINFYSQK